MKSANKEFTFLLITLLVTLQAMSVVGCGGKDRSHLAPVSGQVTVDGEPVKQGDIRFYPGQGRMAIGEIVDGQYSLRTYQGNDGATIGKHKVTVKALQTKPKRMPKFNPPPDATPEQIKALEAEMLEEMEAVFIWIVPEKYSNLKTTTLTAEVQSGENPIDFDIKSK